MTTILSERADGMGYYYGYSGDDRRQINVRHEAGKLWVAYVGGKVIGERYVSKTDAEAAALEFMRLNPQKRITTNA
jgi:hypothetical protein